MAGNHLLFEVNTGTGFEILWRTNGSVLGTQELRRYRSLNIGPGFALAVGDTLLFNAGNNTWGRELWKTNGTPGGTKMVEDIAHGKRGSHPRGMTLVGTTVYFSGHIDRLGSELWRTSGSFSDARLVWDVNRNGNGYVGSLTLAGNTLFLKAHTELFGPEELFKLDVSPHIPWRLLLED